MVSKKWIDHKKIRSQTSKRYLEILVCGNPKYKTSRNKPKVNSWICFFVKIPLVTLIIFFYSWKVKN